MSDREIYMPNPAFLDSGDQEIVTMRNRIARLETQALIYRKALEEIRDYEIDQEDFVGIANVMQSNISIRLSGRTNG